MRNSIRSECARRKQYFSRATHGVPSRISLDGATLTSLLLPSLRFPASFVYSNDGYISVDELTAILSRKAAGGSELARENAQYLIKIYDTANNGKSNIDEVSDKAIGRYSASRISPLRHHMRWAISLKELSHELTSSVTPCRLLCVRSSSLFCSTLSPCASHCVCQDDESAPRSTS